MAATGSLFSHKLSDFCPWNQDNHEGDISDKVVLFLDDSLLTSYHHSGMFAMDSLLLKYCRSPEHKVVLILANHNSSHYQSILMKNLLDVNVLHGSGKLESYRLVSQFIKDSSTMLPWLASNPLTPGKPTSNSWSQDKTWNELIGWQQEQLANAVAAENDSTVTTPLKTIVFIDDLDAFESIAPSPAEARYFVHQFMRILSRQCNSVAINSLVCFGRLRDNEETSLNSQIVAVGGDASTKEKLSSLHIDRQEPLLTTYLHAHAHWVILAAALRTGLSSLVHGTLTIHHIDLFSSKSTKRKQVLQYRALDSGVQCVASE